MEERWLICNDEDIPDYEVSDEGRIRNPKTGRILKTQINSKGYEVVNIRGKNKRVHRLVAQTFLETDDDIDYDILDVAHKDGDKTKNRVSNLEYRTRSDNIKQTYINGRKQTHRMRPIRCVETGEEYSSIEACARATGLSKHAISKCVNGATRHLHNGLRFEAID